MERETTVRAKLAPQDLVLKSAPRRRAHPVFLIMLGAVILLFVVVTAKRF